MQVSEIVANIYKAKNEVRKWEEEYAKAQANCSHMFRRERESDGHTTYTTYTCVNCYFMTHMRPADESLIKQK